MGWYTILSYYYRVATNTVMKRTYLYIVPLSLHYRVLHGVHEEAGHQGQQQTVYLVRQRVHWSGLSKDVAGYVRCCRRSIVSHQNLKPERHWKTSEPLELVCMCLFSLITSRKWRMPFCAPTNRQKRLHNSCGITTSVSTAFQIVCTLIKGLVLRVQ